MIEVQFTQPAEFVKELMQAHAAGEITGPLRVTCQYKPTAEMGGHHAYYVAGYPTAQGVTTLRMYAGLLWGIPSHDEQVRTRLVEAETAVLSAAAGLGLDVRGGSYRLAEAAQ